MYDYDDIDRALFSLQLEEPPEDLRASILAVTVEGPREVTAAWPFSFAEMGFVGATLAVAVWLAVSVLHGAAWGANLETSARALGSALGNPTVLAWIGAGASTAVWLSLANLTPLLAGVRSSRA
jgi:hypothetical protein